MRKYSDFLLFALLINSVSFCYCSGGMPSGDAQVYTTAGKVNPDNDVAEEIDTGKAYQNQAADKINELRQMHGAPKLALDKELTASAQKHADKIASTGQMEISCTKNDCKYGENLAMGPPNEAKAIEVKKCIQRWYITEADYDYKTGEAKAGKEIPGAFTQLVWKGSKKVGIGAAEHKETGYIYLVVQFSPPGNIMGLFKKNVLPKGSAGSASNAPTKMAELVQLSPESEAQAGQNTAPVSPKKKLSKGKPYQNMVLDFINTFREKHHAPRLGLDRELTNIAQAGAEKAAKSGKLAYTCEGECAYGENQGQVAPNENIGLGVNAAVQMWYDEESAYNYATGKEKPGKEFPGAFTALVWKGSTKAGVGAAVKESDGSIFVIVTFSPIGNIDGQYIKNVLKP